jgi:hypothetical protein
VRQIRKKMVEIITREVSSVDLKDLVQKFIPEAIGKDIEKSCQGGRAGVGGEGGGRGGLPLGPGLWGRALLGMMGLGAPPGLLLLPSGVGDRYRSRGRGGGVQAAGRGLGQRRSRGPLPLLRRRRGQALPSLPDGAPAHSLVAVRAPSHPHFPKSAAGIYPLQNTFIRKVKILKMPKFDLIKLMEVHGDYTEEVRSGAGAGRRACGQRPARPCGLHPCRPGCLPQHSCTRPRRPPHRPAPL